MASSNSGRPLPRAPHLDEHLTAAQQGERHQIGIAMTLGEVERSSERGLGGFRLLTHRHEPLDDEAQAPLGGIGMIPELVAACGTANPAARAPSPASSSVRASQVPQRADRRVSPSSPNFSDARAQALAAVASSPTRIGGAGQRLEILGVEPLERGKQVVVRSSPPALGERLSPGVYGVGGVHGRSLGRLAGGCSSLK